MGIYINEVEDSEHLEIDPNVRDITFCVICGIFSISRQNAHGDRSVH